MASTIEQFDYEVTRMNKDSQLPFDPYILLCLKHWGATTRDGAPMISDKLMTEQEIDFHVNQLKADLDKLSRTAKRALNAAKEKTQDMVRQRG